MKFKIGDNLIRINSNLIGYINFTVNKSYVVIYSSDENFILHDDYNKAVQFKQSNDNFINEKDIRYYKIQKIKNVIKRRR